MRFAVTAGRPHPVSKKCMTITAKMSRDRCIALRMKGRDVWRWSFQSKRDKLSRVLLAAVTTHKKLLTRPTCGCQRVSGISWVMCIGNIRDMRRKQCAPIRERRQTGLLFRFRCGRIGEPQQCGCRVRQRDLGCPAGTRSCGRRGAEAFVENGLIRPSLRASFTPAVPVLFGSRRLELFRRRFD